MYKLPLNAYLEINNSQECSYNGWTERKLTYRFNTYTQVKKYPTHMISIQRKTNLHTADSELTGGVNTTARPARPDIPSNERATRYFIIVFFF